MKPRDVGAIEVKLPFEPGQIIVGLAAMVMVGPGSILTVIAVVAVQAPLAAVTV